MTTMRVVGECFFWYRLTRVFPDQFHRAVKRLCCVCVYLELYFYLNITYPSNHSHLCLLKCQLIFFPYRPGLTSMQHTTSHTTAVQSPFHNQWYTHIGKQWHPTVCSFSQIFTFGCAHLPYWSWRNLARDRRLMEREPSITIAPMTLFMQNQQQCGLRSLSSTDSYLSPRLLTKVGKKAFSYARRSTWNALPGSLQLSEPLQTLLNFENF